MTFRVPFRELKLLQEYGRQLSRISEEDFEPHGTAIGIQTYQEFRESVMRLGKLKLRGKPGDIQL